MQNGTIGAVDSDTERDKRSLVNVARYPVQVRADGLGRQALG